MSPLDFTGATSMSPPEKDVPSSGFLIPTADQVVRLVAHYRVAAICLTSDGALYYVNRAGEKYISEDGAISALLPSGVRWLDLPLRVECLLPLRSPEQGRVLVNRTSVVPTTGGEMHILCIRPQEIAQSITHDERGRFLRQASHDLRQPLYTIQLLLDDDEMETLPPEFLEIRHKIMSSVASALDIAHHMIQTSMAPIEHRAQFAATSAIHLAQKIQDRYEIVARRKNITLFASLPNVTLETNAVLLERMVGNLVDNAIKNTEAGSVVLAGKCVDGRLIISVTDTGQGIPNENLEHVFQEFYGSPSECNSRPANLGIGLASVAAISRLLNHPTTVKSTEGLGTIFSISVPLAV